MTLTATIDSTDIGQVMDISESYSAPFVHQGVFGSSTSEAIASDTSGPIRIINVTTERVNPTTGTTNASIRSTLRGKLAAIQSTSPYSFTTTDASDNWGGETVKVVIANASARLQGPNSMEFTLTLLEVKDW
jgi:hypothetical protein